MLERSRVSFVGAGVMAEAVIRGLLEKELVDPVNIIAADIRAERGPELTGRYGIRFIEENRTAVEDADIVVLSVKPQSLPQVLPLISGWVPDRALVISIIAGAKIARLAEGLSHPAVVRSMPNTPAQIGQGMTVWTAAPQVTEDQRAQAKALLGALGSEMYVDQEGFLDAATALSGSGPAYVFLFMEALIDAGIQLGFAPAAARQLVLQTVKGSVEYAKISPKELVVLREQVTSPGGTTAAALRSFEQDEFRAAVVRAVQAAHRRSIELGRG